MRVSARSLRFFATTTLAMLAAACSSSSSDTTTDAGHHVTSKDGATTKEAAVDSGNARTVCEPLPVHDAGVGDAATDARDAAETDAKSDAAVADAGTPVDAGPVPCTKDLDCTSGQICDTKTTGANAGTCVANDGMTFCGGAVDAGGAPGTCSVNDDDICCSASVGCVAKPTKAAAGGSACCPGTAGDTYCQTQLSNDLATCGAAGVCTTCMDTCLSANPAAYQKFLGYQVAECGCQADGPCYDTCHTSTTLSVSSACGTCLSAQTQEGLSSTCTLAAAIDCSKDPDCTAYQACAGTCSM